MNIVIIPCFNARDKILKVINDIPDFIDKIIIVDDACPQKTGEYVLSKKKLKKSM